MEQVVVNWNKILQFNDDNDITFVEGSPDYSRFAKPEAMMQSYLLAWSAFITYTEKYFGGVN